MEKMEFATKARRIVLCMMLMGLLCFVYGLRQQRRGPDGRNDGGNAVHGIHRGAGNEGNRRGQEGRRDRRGS